MNIIRSEERQARSLLHLSPDTAARHLHCLFASDRFIMQQCQSFAAGSDPVPLSVSDRSVRHLLSFLVCCV